MMEVEPDWFIKLERLKGIDTPWHTVYHRCNGSDNVCFVPSGSVGIPRCFICKLLVPSTLVGFLKLCRWNIEGE